MRVSRAHDCTIKICEDKLLINEAKNHTQHRERLRQTPSAHDAGGTTGPFFPGPPGNNLFRHRETTKTMKQTSVCNIEQFLIRDRGADSDQCRRQENVMMAERMLGE